MGVDFAANASSKAIKESIDLSAAPDEESPTYTTSINSDNQFVYTFNYNGTWAENKTAYPNAKIGYYTKGNTKGMDGSVQTITLPAGTYKLEVWGAQGGQSHWGSEGGKGGYSRGNITLTTQTTLYVAVGGMGPHVYKLETSGGTPSGGGWNGGGNTLGSGAGAGGGATHIATVKRGDGQLKNYNSYRTEVLVVAGGGGGSENDGPGLTPPITSSHYKGSAGGTQGGVGGYAGNYQTSCHGLGATQTAPGGHCVGTNTSSHSHTSSSWNIACTNGSFGQGGSGVGQSWGGGGGGGGWFGGGGALINGGGGGSGYVNTSRLVSGTTFMNTCGSNGTGDSYSNTGNGKAVITDLTKCATQSSVPTLTLNRHESKTFAFAGTDDATSLLGVDPSSLALSVHTNAVYQVNGLADNATQETLRARTWAATEKADATANAWLSYSFTTNGVSLKATRYWTGTKAFYVRIKNSHGVPSWFKFYASVEGGELKKDKTLNRM